MAADPNAPGGVNSTINSNITTNGKGAITGAVLAATLAGGGITAWVYQNYAPIVSPTLTGTVTLPVGTAALNGAVPHVANNLALKSYSTAYGARVHRDQFYAGVAGGGADYTWSASACSLNTGAGDDGSQVQAAGGGCWIADVPSVGLDIHVFGAYGDLSHSDTAAAQAWFAAATVNGRGWCSTGQYLIDATITFAMPLNGVDLFGAGMYNCQFNASGTVSANFQFTAANGSSTFYGAVKDIGFITRYAGAGVLIGKSDYSDAFNSVPFSNVYIKNADTGSGSAPLQINYVVQGVFQNIVTAGGNSTSNGDALQLRHAVNNTFVGGAFTTAKNGIHLLGLSSNANTFIGTDIENTCVQIQNDNTSTVSNSFVGTKIGALLSGCASSAVLNSSGGGGNEIRNPELGPYASWTAAFGLTNTGFAGYSNRYPQTIASLPTCDALSVGTRQFINNGLASPTYHQAVSATGTGMWPVWCTYNGSAYGWAY